MPKIVKNPPTPEPVAVEEERKQYKVRIAMYTHGSRDIRDPDDDYPTPPGFLYPLLAKLDLPKDTDIWDPCAGSGHVIKTLRQEGYTNLSYDDLVWNGQDFLETEVTKDTVHDWIITNPPYKLADAFVRKAQDHTTGGVAMLLNTSFLEGIRRAEGLYTDFPPSHVLLNARKMKIGGGKMSVYSHVWIVWQHDHEGPTEFGWLKPDRELAIPTENAGVWFE